jgi:hypothetical protein
MSKEWLAQLSQQAARQGKARYMVPTPVPPQRPQQPARPASPVDRQTPGGSFIGAIFGSIFRWAFLALIAGVIAVMVISSQEGLQDPIGEQVLYAIWYLAAVTIPYLLSLPDTAINANAIYAALKPHSGLLPVFAPLAFGVAVTLLFLPSVNARRRGSGLRFVVFLANLALFWFLGNSLGRAIDATGANGWIDWQAVNLMPAVGWLALLVISFAGGSRRRWAVPARAPAMSRPSPGATSLPAQNRSARSGAVPARSSAQQLSIGRGEPAIQRTVTGGSWRRPR